jgi:hypothetical protein
MIVGATPYKLFLKVPWVNKQLASSVSLSGGVERLMV